MSKSSRQADGKITVVLAERSDVVAQGLQRLLGAMPEVDSVHRAVNSARIRRLVAERSVTLAILDAGFSNGSIGDLIRGIRGASPSTKIAVLCVLSHEPEEARSAGADFVLQKDCEPERIEEMVRESRVKRPGRSSRDSGPGRAQ